MKPANSITTITFHTQRAWALNSYDANDHETSGHLTRSPSTVGNVLSLINSCQKPTYKPHAHNQMLKFVSRHVHIWASNTRRRFPKADESTLNTLEHLYSVNVHLNSSERVISYCDHRWNDQVLFGIPSHTPNQVCDTSSWHAYEIQCSHIFFKRFMRGSLICPPVKGRWASE